MSELLEVQICYGTLCFVMGGSAFEMIEEKLPEDIKGKVLVKGMNCPGFCNSQANGRPPFVKVNGKMIADANIHKIIKCIREEVLNGSNK